MSLLNKENLESDEMFDEEYEKFKSKNLYKNTDGTLNKKAIALTGIGAALILGIFGVVGHNLISSNGGPVKGYLDTDEGRDAVENAFFEALEQYTNGDITADEFKDVLTKLISDYIKTNGMFTEDQKAELEKYIADYIASQKIESLIEMNTEHIDKLTKEFNKYKQDNERTLELLRESLQKEIDENAAYTEEQLNLLKDLQKKLENLELKHFQNIEQYISETIEKYDHITNEITYNMQNGLRMWEANKEYKINEFVLYVVQTERHDSSTDKDLDITSGFRTTDIRMFQNITGVNTAKDPVSDTKNWREVSLGKSIQNIYNMTTEDVLSYSAWLTNHKTDENGTVIDQYVLHDNYLYRNKTGEYDPSKTPDQDDKNWEKLSLAEAINNNYITFLQRLYGGISEWKSGASYKPNAYVMYKNQLYRNVTGVNTDVTPDLDTVNWDPSSITTVIQNTYNTFLAATGAKDYEPGATYVDGDYVIYNNTIYKNVTNNTETKGGQPIPGVVEGDGTKSVWIPVTLTDMIDQNYQTFIQTIGAEDYNSTHSYQAGDYVIMNGVLYRATDVTSGSFDASKWERVTVTDQLEALSRDLEELELKSSLNMEQLGKNLTELINDNKSLTDEQREQMLAIIEGNADVSKEGLNTLYEKLLEIINGNDTANEKEREKLLEQIKALTDNTASYMDDYEKRITAIEKEMDGRFTSNGVEMNFGYDESTGSYGYYVGGVYNPETGKVEGGSFKPW